MPGTVLDVSEPEEALFSRRWLWSGGVGERPKEGEQLGKVHSDEVTSEFESGCGLQRVSRSGMVIPEIIELRPTDGGVLRMWGQEGQAGMSRWWVDARVRGWCGYHGTPGSAWYTRFITGQRPGPVGVQTVPTEAVTSRRQQ